MVKWFGSAGDQCVGICEKERKLITILRFSGGVLEKTQDYDFPGRSGLPMLSHITMITVT